MEQKQLDEMEESFFEEFVDDEPLASGSSDKLGRKVEVDNLELSGVKKTKKVSTKSAAKKSEKKASSRKETMESETKNDLETDPKVEIIRGFDDEVEIKPAKEPLTEKASKVKDEPVDPWGNEKEGPDMFKDVSTWKAITGVAVLLLVISLFTQGFNFSADSDLTGASTASLSLSEAEEKVVNYVNTYLLQPPFLAEAASSEELDNLYKVTLDVAGQVVDSYLTKDGQLFFPQGFEVKNAELDFAVPTDVSDVPLEVNVDEELAVEDENAPASEGSGDEESGLEEPEESPDVEEVVTIPVNAKKWVFAPDIVHANKGEIVRLAIMPQGLDFTFSIPELGIEKEISGQTVVEFTASEVGTFQFECSSCEDWRGMTGTLIIK